MYVVYTVEQWLGLHNSSSVYLKGYLKSLVTFPKFPFVLVQGGQLFHWDPRHRVAAV